MMDGWLTSGLLLLTSGLSCSCFSILALTPPVGNSSSSHFRVMERLSELLVTRGHHVTLPLHEHMSSGSSLVEVVSVPSAVSAHTWHETGLTFMTNTVYRNLTLTQITTMVVNQARECDVFLGDQATYDVLSQRRYDVAIVDHVFVCGWLYAARLNLPVIGLECGSNLASVMDLPAPYPLSTSPVPLTGLPQRMSFIQRCENVLMYWMNRVLGASFLHGQYQDVQDKHGLSHVDLSRVKEDTMIWISNQGWMLDYSRPLLPNMILAPGLLTGPATNLSQEFQAVYDLAGDAGVVIVSFGSYITLEGLPVERHLLDGLSQLPLHVIYRAGHVITDQPINVHVFPHLPQNDLLGQPGTRACVLHGGLNGIYEAVYHAVPMLIIPADFDALDNAVRVHEKGMGRYMDAHDVTARHVMTSLMDVISNHSYRQSVERYSAILRDAPQPPLETAAFWVEHVLRHGTRDYVMDAGRDLTYIQRHLLDVWAVGVTILVMTSSGCVYLCLRCVTCLGRTCKVKSD